MAIALYPNEQRDFKTESAVECLCGSQNLEISPDTGDGKKDATCASCGDKFIIDTI